MLRTMPSDRAQSFHQSDQDQFSGLSETAIGVLNTAAILGRDFELEEIQALSPELTGASAFRAIDEAVRAGLLIPTGKTPASYRFADAQIPETLVRILGPAEQAIAHARVAELLEKFYGSEADEHAAELSSSFSPMW